MNITTHTSDRIQICHSQADKPRINQIKARSVLKLKAFHKNKQEYTNMQTTCVASTQIQISMIKQNPKTSHWSQRRHLF